MEKEHSYDINQFPREAGMLVFGISMSRISNAQDAANCFAGMQHLSKKIVRTDGVGLTFLYSDTLYMHSDTKADALRRKFLGSMFTHKNHFQKILSKHVMFVPKAFSYLTWSQALLHTKDFQHLYGELLATYKKDKVLRACVAHDSGKKKPTMNEVEFILEESLVLYLMAKGKTAFPNEFLGGKERWILHCYPGEHLATEALLMQKNPFKLHNAANKYENFVYDLAAKKLIDLTAVTLPA